MHLESKMDSQPEKSEMRRSKGYGSINVVNVGQKDQEVDHARMRLKKYLGPTLAGFVVCVLVFGYAMSSPTQQVSDNANLASSNSAELLQMEKPSSGSDCKECHDPPHYYDHQRVDHFDDGRKDTWKQRYYTSDKHFGGPGHPIFMVIGGEGEALGLFYPYVQDHLAKKFKAYVLQPELRFYGKSQPIKVEKNTDMIGLLTTEQAIADSLQLLEHIQKKLKCSLDRSSKHYCQVITVGGSYPGFLSALLRITRPDKIDISYAASAPLNLYSQDVDPDAYFELVTRTADQSAAGCASAVRKTLEETWATIVESVSFLEEAKKMNICLDHIPEYIDSKELFAQEVTMIIGENFADFNMAFYPPTPESSLSQACNIFQNNSLDSYGKIDAMFQLIDSSNGVEYKTCGFDLRTQLPDGADATVSGSDWTGSGSGPDGLSWDFQCCTELVVQTGFSEKSMFYPREFSLEWLTQHCQSRFGLDPTPTHLVDKFHFDDLSNVSRVLFTNGLNDGWSASSILKSDNPNIAVLNFPNGAHHSDLTHEGPSDMDTDDLKRGHIQIMAQIGTWLEEIKTENKAS